MPAYRNEGKYMNKKLFPALLAVLIPLLFLFSCGNIFDDISNEPKPTYAQSPSGNGSGNPSGAYTYTVSGSFHLSGSVPKQLEDAFNNSGFPPLEQQSKSAMPEIDELALTFYVSAKNDAGTVIQGDVLNSVTGVHDFIITLQAGTWTLTGEAGISPDIILLRGTSHFTIDENHPVVADVDVKLCALQTAGKTGSISLEMSIASTASINSYSMECISGNVAEWNSKAVISSQPGNPTVMLETVAGQEIASGTYLVCINFYRQDASGKKFLQFSTTQQINVFDGMTTDKWYSEGGSADSIISTGVLTVNLGTVNAFQSKTLYVDGTNGKSPGDGGNGTWINPFNAVCDAIAKADSPYSTLNDFIIYVTGETSETAQIILNKNFSIAKWPDTAGKPVIKRAASYTADESLIVNSTTRTLKIENVSIDGASIGIMMNGAGINNKGTLELKNVDLLNCKTSTGTYGGGIYNGSGCSLTMTGGTISGCAASGSGGGIYSMGTVLLDDVEINGCSTGNNGGGIYSGSSLTMTGGKISSCTASGSGGGIYSMGTVILESDAVIGDDTKTTVATSTSYSNSAASNGGGIYASSTLTISDTVKISYNYSATQGGGLYHSMGTLTISDNVTIAYNRSKNQGGGITAAGTATIDCESIGYNGSGGGGGVYLTGTAAVTFNSGLINDNRAYASGSSGGTGGGVQVSGGTFTLAGGEIKNNTSDKDGGGVFIASGKTFKMTGGAISGNTADSTKGTGIYQNGTFEISGSALLAENDEVYLKGTNLITIAGTLSPAGGITAHVIKEAAVSGTQVLASGTYLASNYNKFVYAGPYEINTEGKLVGSYYVAGDGASVLGSDVTGDGSKAKPFATVYKALSVAASGEIISIDGVCKEDNALSINSSDKDDITIKKWAGKTSAVIQRGTNTSSMLSVGSGYMVTFDGITFDGDNVATTYGILCTGNLNLTDCEVRNFRSNSIYGGGITCRASASPSDPKPVLTFENTIIKDCHSSLGKGGGIYGQNATINITGGNISSCSAASGGGIYSDGGTLTIEDCMVKDCEAIQNGTSSGIGGGIYVNSSGTITNSITGGSISGCKSTKDGGGLYLSFGILTLDGVVVGDDTKTAAATSVSYSNHAGTNGGGIYSYSGTLTINDTVKIAYNYAVNQGGGIANFGKAAAGGYIQYNGAALGAGIYTQGNSSEFNLAAHVNNNHAYGTATENGGGGIFIKSSATLNMTAGEIKGNISDKDAGGVYIASGNTFTMTGGTISGNTKAASGKGAGIYQNGNFSISGGALLAETDDVYLEKDHPVTIAGALTGDSCATITYGGTDINDQPQVLTAASPSVISASYGKFAISNAGYVITEQGKLLHVVSVADLGDGVVPNSTDYPNLTVSTVDELLKVAGWVNNGDSSLDGINFLLTSDIALDDTWTPIGRYDSSNGKYFKGYFDGQGYTISYDIGDAGKNFAFIGALQNGSVSNLNATGTIRGTNATYSSPIVGYIKDNGHISNCTSSVNMEISGSGFCGGIVGDVSASAVGEVIVENCINTGNITCGRNSVGGIAGAGYNGVFTNCINNGNITASAMAGGIVGQTRYTTVTNSGNTGAVTANWENDFSNSGAGGIVAGANVTNEGWGEATITNCWSTGTIQSINKNTTCAGGIYGNYSDLTRNECISSNCYYLSGSCARAIGNVSDPITGVSTFTGTASSYSVGGTDLVTKLNQNVSGVMKRWKYGADGYPTFE